jgi:hypothetical protein
MPKLRRCSGLLIGLVAMVVAADDGSAQEPSDTPYGRAVSTLYASARIAVLVEQWCADRAPEFTQASTGAREAWRQQQGLLDLEDRMASFGPALRRKLDSGLESSKSAFYAKLDGGGSARWCRDLAGFFAKNLDLRTQYPGEYRLLAEHPMTGSATVAAPVAADANQAVTPSPVRSADNQGISPTEIDGVYLEQNTGFGVGGMIIIQYDPVLMLKDGWAYDGWTASPADLDVTASRKVEPKSWRRYERRGDQIRIQDHKGVWSKFDKWHQVVPAGPGDRLAGAFSHLGGGGNTAYGGSTMIVASNSYTFGRDGTFTSKTAVGVSGGNEATNPNGPPGVVATSNRSTSGTYLLDGYTLELRYRNGRVIRKAFLWFDEKMHDSFFLDGQAFLDDK